MANQTHLYDAIPQTGYYGYIPTFWVCCTFITLFSLTTIIHLLQAVYIKPRLHWLIPTVGLCGLGEIIGWSGRLWGSLSPLNRAAFMMQFTTTVISPVFLSAALYTVLGSIIRILGKRYSRLNPGTYLKIFIAADIVSLLVQTAGGVITALANNTEGFNMGTNVMLGGIQLQMAGMLCYAVLASEVVIRFGLKRPITRTELVSTVFRASSSSSTVNFKEMKQESIFLVPRTMPFKLKLLVLSLSLTTFLILIRSIYRTAELTGGWGGPIFRTEIYFNLLDATPIALSLYIFNILSPAFLLKDFIY